MSPNDWFHDARPRFDDVATKAKHAESVNDISQAAKALKHVYDYFLGHQSNKALISDQDVPPELEDNFKTVLQFLSGQKDKMLPSKEDVADLETGGTLRSILYELKYNDELYSGSGVDATRESKEFEYPFYVSIPGSPGDLAIFSGRDTEGRMIRFDVLPSPYKKDDSAAVDLTVYRSRLNSILPPAHPKLKLAA